jgi:FkbM family methyltransferase
MFYSQFGEDKILSNYFNDDYKGVCVEVGAYDGISGSNTYYFEKKGWETLCIEPTPESFNKCASIRKKCINCCVSNYDSENIEYSVVTLNGYNTSAISSLNIDNRLIESHKDMINNIEKISVNVKTLNNIFKETDFPKKIDFISIDTENTELDVLKGLNFDEYDIKFFVIENNFDENQVEEYLKTKNFKKLFRNAVNDFYVNNNYINTSILDIFEIKKAVYYIEDSDDKGIVTDTVKLLLQKYKLSEPKNNSVIIVSNEIFTDTFIFKPKKLYITLENTYNSKQYKFIFDEGETLDFIKINNNLLKYIDHHSYKIETSIGEILDKFSILELKQKYITNIDKLSEIQKELDVLSKFITNTDKFFYNLLLHINELIWLDTDVIKGLTLDKKEYNNIYLFAEISNRIFENNQKRFRLKNYFNVLQNSNIKEQKSYNNNSCYIDIKDENELYQKIAEINFLIISYDLIYINIDYKSIFNKLFKNINIFFTEQKDNYEKYYKLETFIIEQNIRKIYEFEPIKYVSGGKFGDFFNQLSVVAENYYETGKKGILFIQNRGDNFSNGLENTYNDTFETIMDQEYIYSYNIFNNEMFDIDLSSWRTNLNDYANPNWKNVFSTHYKIDWGKHKWLNTTFNSEWENKITINNNYYEELSENSINTLRQVINNNKDTCVFISNDIKSYYIFLKIIGITIKYYQLSTFSELVKIVNSSKLSYVGFSSTAVILNALHKPHILTGSNNWRYPSNNLKEVVPHVLDILI